MFWPSNTEFVFINEVENFLTALPEMREHVHVRLVWIPFGKKRNERSHLPVHNDLDPTSWLTTVCMVP